MLGVAEIAKLIAKIKLNSLFLKSFFKINTILKASDNYTTHYQLKYNENYKYLNIEDIVNEKFGNWKEINKKRILKIIGL